MISPRASGIIDVSLQFFRLCQPARELSRCLDSIAPYGNPCHFSLKRAINIKVDSNRSGRSCFEQPLLFVNGCPVYNTLLQLKGGCRRRQSRLTHIRRSHSIRDVCAPDYLQQIFRRRVRGLITMLAWSAIREVGTACCSPRGWFGYFKDGRSIIIARHDGGREVISYHEPLRG